MIISDTEIERFEEEKEESLAEGAERWRVRRRMRQNFKFSFPRI